jgi:single-stranded-DNA-specific exonuclease
MGSIQAQTADQGLGETLLDGDDAGSLPEDVAPDEPRFELPPCDPRAVAELCETLNLNPLAAQTLVRRGIADRQSATEFLDGGELEAAERLPGAPAAAGKIAEHVRAGSRIAVHGDYDVDGVCSTAILVRTLDRLGAQVTWHVPSRFDEGYGLSASAVERLAADGAGLIVAVDCGVTAVAEAELARSLGVDIAICDHHTPGETLPAAPIAHPALGDYVCPQLCAAAVTFKVCRLLAGELGADPAILDDELALVALATVCDVVPLRGENRALVRRGLDAMRTTLRPGLRELMRAAAVDQLAVDAGALGFRLGPRINAAGRMFSAEPAVELMLTGSERRAAELATALNASNSQRQEIEKTILFEAETQARRQRDRFAIVVAGEGWHAGVLGIVAGRIAERFRRPCVALGIADGVAAGSGRGGGVYDLLAGLTACSEHLIRYGGHRAAAGLQLDAAALPAFTRAFQNHAATVLTADDLRPRVKVDAVAEPSQLTLAAAEGLERVGPFGSGNPEPALLLPAVKVTQLKRMGEGGRHLKLGIAGQGGRAGVVAFGWERAVKHGDQAPLSNIVVKLRRNEFRGVVEGQARLVAHAELPPAEDAPADSDTVAAWLNVFNDTYSRPLPAVAGDSLDSLAVTDRRADSALAVIAELAGDIAACTLLVNDPADWTDRLHALSLIDQRFADLRVLAYADPAAQPPAEFDHVVLGEQPLALDRSHVVAAYRIVKEAADSSLHALRPGLSAALPNPSLAARAVRVLDELELVRVEQSGETVESIVVTAGSRTELDRSPAFRSYSEVKDRSERWLAQLTLTKATLVA